MNRASRDEGIRIVAADPATAAALKATTAVFSAALIRLSGGTCRSSCSAPAGPMTTPDRWPGWVYDHGEEPDYRFTYANERTFLAWLRTALALLAGGVALDALTIDMPVALRRALSAVLLVAGLLCAIMSWARWARAERAMRENNPLPASHLGMVLAIVIVAVAVVVLAVAI